MFVGIIPGYEYSAVHTSIEIVDQRRDDDYCVGCSPLTQSTVILDVTHVIREVQNSER